MSVDSDYPLLFIGAGQKLGQTTSQAGVQGNTLCGAVCVATFHECWSPSRIVYDGVGCAPVSVK